MSERSTVSFLAAAAAAASDVGEDDGEDGAVKLQSVRHQGEAAPHAHATPARGALNADATMHTPPQLRDRIEAVLSGVGVRPTATACAPADDELDAPPPAAPSAPGAPKRDRMLEYDFFRCPSSLLPDGDELETSPEPPPCGPDFSMLADLRLLLDDGTRLYASRAILGMWSRVLNEILTAMPETREISMRRLAPAEMVAVLTFMYDDARRARAL